MKNYFRWFLACVMLACLAGCMLPAQAQDGDNSKSPNDRQIVSVGHDSVLPAGENAQDVVAVMGNSEVDGDVSDSAVAVMGNVTLNGNAGDSAVAVLGNVYINGKVNGDVVAVLGNVKLGPQAVIGGQVTEVMGTLERSPTAVIQGGTVGVMSGVFGDVEGFHAWVRHSLVFGRPLAPDLEISWAWWFALGVFVLYVLIAAVFPDGVRRCVQTLDMHPGLSVLTTLIAVLLLPIVLVALCITVVGIPVIPLLAIALFCAGIFGRVVALGWLGARCLRLSHSQIPARAVLEVLLGGVIALVLYMIPVLGFLTYFLLGIFGFGAVLYTLLRAIRPATPKAVPGGPPAGGATATGGATVVGTVAATSPAWTASAAAEPPVDHPSAESTAGAHSPPPPPPPPNAPLGHTTDILDITALPRAGFWIRMLALLIDLILVGVATSWVHREGHGTLLLLAIYGAVMWKLKGTTIGGIVCDLKVVRVGGAPLDWGTAIVRALACFLSLIICGLGFIWIAVDHDHQAWHDKIAGTVVVRVPKGVALV